MRPFTIVLIAALLAVPVLAAESPAPEPDVARELARLNATLTEIRALLERQLETQGLDLLMKRMELAASQVADAENQLARAQATRASLADERAHVDERVRLLEEQLRRGEADARELEDTLEQYEFAGRRLQGRLEEQEREIVELESRLAGKQRDLREWQEVLDRRLANP